MSAPGGDAAGHRTGAPGAPAEDLTHWDEAAKWWQDGFTDGADPEYTEQILPLIASELAGRGLTVDIGCGEGQVARHLAATGTKVVGVEPVAAQIGEAHRREASRVGAGSVDLVRASALHLPLADGCADAAVVCLVFEHIADHGRALSEVARVLRPGGRFLFLLNHPLLQTPDSGWIDDQVMDPPEQYWRVGAYLTETATVEQVEAGVFIRFHHRILSTWVNTAAEVGLGLERMFEPAPPAGFVAQAPEYVAAASIPRLLGLRFVRSAAQSPRR